ncbi:hypothetical protein CCZ01_05020 [Helicobacter monodelphidis]|uniref:HobA family DNA replication regulator n=1 Tax=Helicobacter sp. 15-1451 TaxID=2004995 RepID=UPI000DCB93AA|nr:HobA family DNA replication regulator [Helicobacter sp. 15-1451]RAX57811.1 hypothetical protein CCZ01_05020 [Helicobacter sp. 15-1451]
MENKDFYSWTIKTIRNDASKPAVWLEDRKTEWIALTQSVLMRILDGYSVILMSDEERSWFVDYILHFLNHPRKGRPFIPLYSLNSVYTQFYHFDSDPSDVSLLQDMLAISLGDKYIFWYIGRGSGTCAKLSLGREFSFNWILDDRLQNSFWLQSDELLDIKLMQLLRIFDKSLSAAIFGDVNLES